MQENWTKGKYILQWAYFIVHIVKTVYFIYFNPPTDSCQDISAVVHLKVKHCQTLCAVSTFTGHNALTVFFYW